MIRSFLSSAAATASVEMALLLPLLVALLFGSLEAGHFVWTQHKLVEAVRDGARYASRLQVDHVCNGATSILTTADSDTVKLLTRTGQVANTSAGPVVPGWTAAQVSVTVNCEAFVNTGIYTDYGAAGPIVTVAATGVTYPALFGGLGVLTRNITLTAKSNAAVIGL